MGFCARADCPGRPALLRPATVKRTSPCTCALCRWQEVRAELARLNREGTAWVLKDSEGGTNIMDQQIWQCPKCHRAGVVPADPDQSVRLLAQLIDADHKRLLPACDNPAECLRIMLTVEL